MHDWPAADLSDYSLALSVQLKLNGQQQRSSNSDLAS